MNDVVATVGTNTLHLSTVLKHIQTLPHQGDSAQMVDSYIQEWIRETVLIDKAHDLLSEAERDKSDLVSRYYNDLIIFELEKKLLSEKLDTSVNDAATLAYYESNRKNFELKENIVRLRFFTIPEDIKNHDKLWARFVLGGEKNMNLLSRVCDLSKSNYFYNDSVWLSFTDILKEVPIQTYNQENYLNNHRYVRLKENNYSYFVEILDFKIKNTISPYEFEKERIRDIIIHKRKVELLQQMENEIVEEAYRNNKIETF